LQRKRPPMDASWLKSKIPRVLSKLLLYFRRDAEGSWLILSDTVRNQLQRFHQRLRERSACGNYSSAIHNWIAISSGTTCTSTDCVFPVWRTALAPKCFHKHHTNWRDEPASLLTDVCIHCSAHPFHSPSRENRTKFQFTLSTNSLETRACSLELSTVILLYDIAIYFVNHVITLLCSLIYFTCICIVLFLCTRYANCKQFARKCVLFLRFSSKFCTFFKHYRRCYATRKATQ